MDVDAAFTVLWGYLLSGAVGLTLGVIWGGSPMGRSQRGEARLLVVGAMSVLMIGMAIALVFTSIQAGVAKQYNADTKASITALEEQTTDNERQSDCQQVALEHLVASLLPRAAFSEQEAKVQLVFSVAQLQVFVNLREAEGVSGDALDDLIEASYVRIKSLRELLRTSTIEDLPNLSEIEGCRN